MLGIIHAWFYSFNIRKNQIIHDFDRSTVEMFIQIAANILVLTKNPLV